MNSPKPDQRRTALVALRGAQPIPVDPQTVEGCLDLADERDLDFEILWRSRMSNPRSRSQRRVLPGVIGHIAESTVEVMLAERSYVPLAHHPGPGRHGVDLLMLHPANEMVFAIEVKGTLRSGFIPRLTSGDLAQMSSAWIDKRGNPAMVGAALESADVFGAIAAINPTDLTLRVALTTDFAVFRPVAGDGELSAPSRD